MASNEPVGVGFKNRSRAIVYSPAVRAKMMTMAKEKRKEAVALSKIVHVIHRFVILSMAVLHIVLCFAAAWTAVDLLRGKDNATISGKLCTFDLMAQYAGTQTIRESPLVVDVFSSDTSPVPHTTYLTVNGTTSSGCYNLAEVPSTIYSNTFLRSVFTAIQTDVAYKHTELSDWELVSPVVDCSSSDVTDPDSTNAKFSYLARSQSNPEDVFLFIVSFAVFEYWVTTERVRGPAAVATIQQVRHMQATNVNSDFLVAEGFPFRELSFRAYEYINTTTDGQWTLSNIPKTKQELKKMMLTSRRSGFYIKAESEQSNVNSMLWVRSRDAASVVSRWQWTITPVLHDSWAWVHGVQFWIGMSVVTNLVILTIATQHIVRAGKLWIGDAFVSLSSSQLVNGGAILVSWFVNEYWSLTEFAMHMGHHLAGLEQILIYDFRLQADLMTVYFSACGIIGTILHERIDPIVAVLSFTIGYQFRIAIITAMPTVHDYISAHTHSFYLKSVVAPVEGQEEISPMRFWASHPVGAKDFRFIGACLFPICIMLVLVVIYALTKKLHRHYGPGKLQVVRADTTSSPHSSTDDMVTTQKRVLTRFELATGAELENRFGLAADYETYIIIKGMKFASADGIYSNGFVIANRRYLVQTRDLSSILFMKVLRSRYKNIYVYDVDGSTVQQTARLVYPQTLTLADLYHLNISVLS